MLGVRLEVISLGQSGSSPATKHKEANETMPSYKTQKCNQQK